VTTAADNPATTAARVLLQALTALGVREVVLAPGSRSAPLAYALADAARPDGDRPVGAPSLTLHVRVDERSAVRIRSGRPACEASRTAGCRLATAVPDVVTTATGRVSPTASAALASPSARNPADRPHELRGTGANQTTDQVGLFG